MATRAISGVIDAAAVTAKARLVAASPRFHL
jgi:hypothetical protein